MAVILVCAAVMAVSAAAFKACMMSRMEFGAAECRRASAAASWFAAAAAFLSVSAIAEACGGHASLKWIPIVPAVATVLMPSMRRVTLLRYCAEMRYWCFLKSEGCGRGDSTERCRYERLGGYFDNLINYDPGTDALYKAVCVDRSHERITEHSRIEDYRD